MMELHMQPLRRNRLSEPVARPWASRLLASLGVALMTIGVYAPVAGRDMLIQDAPIGRYSETASLRDFGLWSIPVPSMQRMSVYGQLGVEIVYAILILGGLALIPLLWQSHSRQGAAIARWLYAIWLSLLILLVVALLPAWHQFMTQPPPGLPATLEASYLLPGVAIFPPGLLVSGTALTLMFREPLPSSSLASTPRTRWQKAAALTILVGLLVWVIGFYLMPEAITAACPPVTFSVTQFAHDACAGLDSDQVLVAASSNGLNPLGRLLSTLGWHVELLVAAGCITALSGWVRRLSVAALVWLAVWPLLALGVAFVALQGVSEIARQGFKLTYATGDGWHVGSGMVVTFVGIGLVALGQIGLWRELARHSKAGAG